MWRRPLIYLTLSLATLACSHSPGGTPTSTAAKTSAESLPEVSSSAADTSANAMADAQAALDAYWRMVKRLLAAPDPADGELAQRAVDPSLSALVDLLTTRRSTHQVARYDGVPYHVDTFVASASGATASFAGCIVDGAHLVDVTTGAVVNDNVSTSRIEGALVNVEGAWKVQRYDVLRKVGGEVACAELA